MGSGNQLTPGGRELVQPAIKKTVGWKTYESTRLDLTDDLNVTICLKTQDRIEIQHSWLAFVDTPSLSRTARPG